MSTIKNNLIYNMGYQLFACIIPLITAPYVSRVLGAEGIGTYSYTYTVANYFVLFAMLGVNNYGNREIAYVRNDRKRLNQTFSSIFCLHSLLSISVIFTYIIYVGFIAEKYRFYAAIQGLYVLSALFDINWFFFGMEEFKIIVSRNMIIKTATIILLFIFIKSPADLWLYIFIMAAGNLTGPTIVWLFVSNYVSFEKITWKELKRHLSPLFILFLPVIAISLYTMMDKLMLGMMAGTVQLGLYESAEKLIKIPVGVINAFGIVMLPRMSNLAASGLEKKSLEYMGISIKYIMFIAFAFAFGIAGVTEQFAPLFFGSEFSECAVLISGLCFTIPFRAFEDVLRTQYLTPHEMDMQYIISVSFGAVINLALNLLLIPGMQALGAVTATVITEVCVSSSQAFMLRKKLPIGAYIISWLPFLIIGMIMFGIVRLIGSFLAASSAITLIVQITSGIFIYLGLSLIFLRTFDY